MEFKNLKISIIGQGYVGLPLAIEFGKKYSTIGFDVNIDRINELKSGLDNTNEASKDQIESSINLIFSSNLNDIKDCNVFIVTVPTPVDEFKTPNLEPLKFASKMLGGIIKKGDVIIYESTVFPGATEEICIPIIENQTNLKRNIDFSYGYSPERINPGDKEHRLTKIKKVTSGSDEETRLWVDELYGSIIEAGTFSVCNIKTAEAAKIIENTQRDLNIALINELTLIFQTMGLNTKEVLDGASTKWNFIRLFPGLVGGHCIGVDPYYLTYKAMQLGYSPNLILSGRKVNDAMGSEVAKILLKEMVKNAIVINSSKILIMGFAFKKNCPDIRNTGVINVHKELIDFGCEVSIYDPLVDKEKAAEIYNLNIIEEIPKLQFDSILIAVGHDCFKELGIEQIKNYRKENGVILDLEYIFYKEEDVLYL